MASARAGVDDVAQVRLALVGERGRDAQQDGVAVGERSRIGRRRQAVADRGEAVVADILDAAVALREELDGPGVDVEADDVVARLGERDRERQADVPEPDDPDPHGAPV